MSSTGRNLERGPVPPCRRYQREHENQRRGEHEERRWKQAADATSPGPQYRNASRALGLSDKVSNDEESGEKEKHVHLHECAGKSREQEVINNNCRNRKSPESLNFRSDARVSVPPIGESRAPHAAPCAASRMNCRARAVNE